MYLKCVIEVYKHKQYYANQTRWTQAYIIPSASPVNQSFVFTY